MFLSDLSIILAICLILTSLFIVLAERKFLAYAHRRMGPAIMGRNGAFQIALDLTKLVNKETFIIPRPSSSLAPIFLTLLYVFQLLFSQQFILTQSGYLFDNVDSVILHHLILIILGNIFFLLVGLISQSRYAIIGTVRAIIHTISLDIFITIIYSLLVFSTQSTNFHDWVLMQSSSWFIFLYTPLASTFLVLLILEAKRTPFDHTETESEVVAGYAVEYGGAMLLVFYLAEYLHLAISSIHFVLFFLGGWYSLNLFFFLPPIFMNLHSNSYVFFYFLQK